jgi:hypothetical protein
VGAVRLEPFVEGPQWLGVQAVDVALGIAAELDEAGVAQDLEVTRHPGLVHADPFDEVVDRALVVTELVEDAASSGLGDHIEDLQRVEGVGHGRIIRVNIYVCKRMFIATGWVG